MHLKKHISPHGRVTAVSMMKDEAPYLLEWFAHHLAVGFTDILVYTNDCSDGTVDMLIRLEELGLGYHRRNDIPDGVKPQPSALKYAQKEPVVCDSDWVIVFDADEFLVVKYGDGTLDDVITAAGENDGIVITWRTFGSGSVEDWSTAPVTEQYQYAAPAMWNKGWGVKTLFKFDEDKWKLGIHRPSFKNKVLDTDYPTTINWLNGSGLPMEDYFKFRGWRSIRRTVGYDWLQMNHYAVKSMDAYAIRRLRGNVNNKADKYNSDYWSLQDRNEVKETSISRHFRRRAEIMDELLKDPILNKLHHAAIDRVEARLAEIRKTPEYEELRADLRVASQVSINDVVAKPPKARDAAKIAELMSEVESRAADGEKPDRPNKAVADGFVSAGMSAIYNPAPLDLSADMAVELHPNHDISLPADPRVFSPSAVEDILAGKFDRRNARHIGNLLAPNDRMLNVGSGISFIPMVGCRLYPDLAVLAQDDRSDLGALARQFADANGLGTDGRLKIVDGPITLKTDGKGEASGLKAYINDFRPTVLRLCDYRVTAEVLKNLPLESVHRIIHTGIDPERDQDALQALAAAIPDFAPNPDTVKTGVAVLDRGLR